MSASEILEKSKTLENLPISQIKSAKNDINNQEIAPIYEINPQINLKNGQYILTPIESFLLNKIMPKGFKFETEENVKKSLDVMNNQLKKYKPVSKYGDPRKAKLNVKNLNENSDENYYKTIEHNNKSIKKHVIQNNNINNDHKLKKNKIILKCLQGLEKIKINPNASFFYTQSQPGEQSLSTIEKKINNNEYGTLYDFSMDLRKLWAYNFNKHAKNPEIYQIVLKMSELSEQVISDLEKNQAEKSENINNIKKENEKLKKEHSENNKEQINKKENIPIPFKKSNNQNYDNKMSIEEKNQLGNSIRALNKEQLKGIIKILTDPNDNNLSKSKYFEFDIDKLPTKKLRELDKYVKNCINGINNNVNTISNVNSNVTKLDKPKNLENSEIPKNIEQNPKNKNNENKNKSVVQNVNNNNGNVKEGENIKNIKKVEEIKNDKKTGGNSISHSDDSSSSDSSLSS